MTKILPAIDTGTNTWGDVILRINDLIYFARDNAITTGADPNVGDVAINGNFTSNSASFPTLTVDNGTANSFTVNTATISNLTYTTATGNTANIQYLIADNATINNLTLSNLSSFTTTNITANTANINYITSNQSFTANNIVAVKTTTATANVVNMTITGVQNANNIIASQITTPTLTLVSGNNVLAVSKSTFDNINGQLDDKIQQTKGTWTPRIAIGGNTTNITYTTREATYIRIGDLATIQCRMLLSSKATQTGAVTVLGLPYTATGNANTRSIGSAAYLSTAGITGTIVPVINGAANSVSLLMNAATGCVSVTNANLTNTSDISFTISYRVA